MGLKCDAARAIINIYPNAPSRTLANKLYKDNRALYKDCEDARSAIRRVRGKTGKKDRKFLSDKTHVGFKGKLNPFAALPEGMTDYSDYQIEEINGTKTLLLADIHSPFHNKAALTMALDYGKKMGVDTICFLGDLIDFYAISRWQTDPRKRNIANELETTERIIEIVRDNFPKAEIIYKYGNHDERLENYLMVKAPELLDVEIGKLSELLHLDTYGVRTVQDKHIQRIGHLYLIHGHEFKGGCTSPVNPARGLFLRGGEIATCGHHHITSNHTETTMAGKVKSCWSVGCICELHPSYMPINKWNWGFAVVERSGESFEMHNKKIIDGKIY